MRYIHTILAFLFLSVSITVSHASFEHVARLDNTERRGGKVTEFIARISQYRATRTLKVLDGYCYSSCTLYLTLMNDGLLCAKPGTALVFHEFVKARETTQGDIVTYQKVGRIPAAERRMLWNMYPLHVRQRLSSSWAGGLPEWGNEIIFSARELRVPTCRDVR